MICFSSNRSAIWPNLLTLKPGRFATLALLAGALLAGCSDSPDEGEGAPAQVETAPLRLQVLGPEIREIRESITGTGTIGAAQTSNIGVVTPGIVERVFVKVGDRVIKGQPLFQTRKIDYEINVQLASAEVAAAQARVEQARLDYERAKDLLTKNFVSQAQLDSAGNTQRAAIAEAAVSKARLAQAEQRLADTIVRAPFDGVAPSRNVDEGTYKSAQTFSTDGSVLQLQDIHVVVAVVRVPEIYVTKLDPGTPADLVIDGLNAVIQSEIWVINDKIDAQSRTIEVRFLIDNEDYQVKPGLFVRAEMYPPGRTAMLLNKEAVLDRSGSPYVFLLEDGIARKQAIVLREYDSNSVEIVSGLDPKASVITGPDLERLADGDPIPDSIDAAR